MRESETFRDTMTAYIKCKEFNAQFFNNDVICQYWPFAETIGLLLPQYQTLAEDMRPFLSRVHAQAHGCYCQVSFIAFTPNSPSIFVSVIYYMCNTLDKHWPEGARMLLGEETERVFFYFRPLSKLDDVHVGRK